MGQTTNHGAHWPAVASASRVQFPAGKEAYRLCRWACYRIKFLDRHRGFTCVLFKMWQQQLKFRESFGCCLRRQWNTDVPSHAGCVMAFGPWPAGRPACYWLAHGRPTGVRGRAGLPGSCVAWHKRNKAGLKLGALPNTVQGSLSLHNTHTYRHVLMVGLWRFTVYHGAWRQMAKNALSNRTTKK